MKRIINCLTLFLAAHALQAQSFTHTGTIAPVQEDGLHRLLLPPELRAVLRTDLGDLRIYDEQHREVPFYSLREEASSTSLDFMEYEIVSNTNKQKHTKLVLKPAETAVISSLVLCIANTDVSKYCTVNGSNDRQHWFALAGNRLLSSLYSNTSTEVYKRISFPASSYSYYEIDINDSLSQPLNISKAGTFRDSSAAGKMLGIQADSIRYLQKPGTKTTVVYLVFHNKPVIDEIELEIASPHYYKRNAYLETRLAKTNGRKSLSEWNTIATLDLRSGNPLVYKLPSVKEKQLMIEIDNQDNPPLQIRNILFRQFAAYIVADLHAGQHYTISAGNAGIRAPQYDLAYFRDQAGKSLPNAEISSLSDIQNPSVSAAHAAHFWQSRLFMWICIAAAVAILLLFSLKLLREVRN